MIKRKKRSQKSRDRRVQRQPPELAGEGPELAGRDPAQLKALSSGRTTRTSGQRAILQMQRQVGNAAVQRMLARQPEGAAPETESSPKPVLRRGSQGPAVVDLQGRLNSAGATPALAADGLFGPRVQAAVLAFQRANALAPDGVCGARTWTALEGPGAKGIDPDENKGFSDRIDGLVPGRIGGIGEIIGGLIPGWGDRPGPGTDGPPPKGGIGESIAGIASLQVGLIDYSQLVPSLEDLGQKEPFGWRHLDQIYQRGAGLNWPPSELKKSWRPGKVDWCAIFAVFCYQLAGLDTTWVLGVGAKGSVKKVWPKDVGSREAFEASIRPGDIAAVAAKQHHFVVVSVDQGSGMIQSVDGNQESGQIRARSKHKLSEVVAYYTPA